MTSKHPLIGPAGQALAVLRVKFNRLRSEKRALKALLYGPPGTGKTEAATRLAMELTSHSTDIEMVNGKEITLDFVRVFRDRMRTPSLFSDTVVLLADECDLMTPDARSLMLSVLDHMPANVAFIGTSNADLINDATMKAERFQTRLHPIEVGSASVQEITAHLSAVMPSLPPAIAAGIADACQGNVRAAEIDGENWLDYQAALPAAA